MAHEFRPITKEDKFEIGYPDDYFVCENCGLLVYTTSNGFVTSLGNGNGIGQIPVEKISCNEWIIREIIK